MPDTDTTIRPNHRTTGSTMIGDRVVTHAFAAVGSTCPVHDDCEVERGDPIVLRGKQTVVALDGTRTVDLSGAYWGCDRGPF